VLEDPASFSEALRTYPQVADSDILKTPFVGGNDGLGVVVKVGPGVKNLSDNDWVVPYKPGMGTWRSLAVWREKDVMKIPTDLLPVEYGAMLREMCVAYRLLEDHGTLKPGDSVILNAANSTIGTCVIQLCRMLKLRAIAVVRAKDAVELEQASKRLKALGAAEVRFFHASLLRVAMR
jgi:trans-2-enoyl-CoA reductase